eukprot:CAMPEP_0113309210 /NCGR_PEP_ID=MMETSP0010_2-20120614/7350_1 /TAXON_ID=216773 ORGANISM="Corethron hystrix, Strain 308" /NCGR_SAMPLE_ID=MMETSP0010_2 /ASSEMBLY_ACC=CAM_ASM_000155 /LENGTH=204 /DNA_ID=CAMNT_0000164427 /DNA_START=224 /DNA_END=838 /DNA_ORIENTATION=- /assembly_acc=CAM_ASM_000155
MAMKIITFAVLSVAAAVSGFSTSASFIRNHATINMAVQSSFGGRSIFGHIGLSKSNRGRSNLHMSDSQKESKKQSRVLIKDREDTQTKSEEKEDIKNEGMWKVLLHNDEIHTFEFVTETLATAIPTITRMKAHEICVTTHNHGRGLVTTVWKSQATQHCIALQRKGLSVSVAKDGSGGPNQGGGGGDGDGGGGGGGGGDGPSTE